MMTIAQHQHANHSCPIGIRTRPACGQHFRAALRQPCSRQPLACHAQLQQAFKETTARVAGAAAAGLLMLAPLSAPALANEFDVMNSPTPELTYFIDDAAVLNRTTKKAINDRLYKLESNTGYRVEAVTVRKLEFENDAFSFADKVLAKWYPSKEDQDKKGVVIVVTTGKDGAVSGGPAFIKAVGDDLIDSIIGENIPILTEQEKWNETLTSVVKRLEAKLTGQRVPAAPQRENTERQRTYKTKEEVDKTRFSTTIVVATLLLIAFVVPMLQFYGYVSKD